MNEAVYVNDPDENIDPLFSVGSIFDFIRRLLDYILSLLKKDFIKAD